MNRAEFDSALDRMEQVFSIQHPELEVTVRDHDFGIEGYVVVWNTRISRGGPLEGCGKGGTRITPTVSLEEIKMLARTMALKNSAAGLPLGGAKSGLRTDPDAPDIEKKYRRFIQLTKSFLYENGGCWGGLGLDIGARAFMPYWAVAELGSGRSFTGKPIELGGTDYDKEGVAGLGVAVAARTALKFAGLPIAGCTAAVQGLGAMGGAIVKFFSQYGGTVIEISDPLIGGTFRIPGGLSAAEVESIGRGDFAVTRELLSRRGIAAAPLEELVFADAQILFPAALQDVIMEGNRKGIRAKLIVEGANNPMSDESRQELFGRGVTVIPDFIANPGGVIAAFVEMTSRLTVEENIKTRGKTVEAKRLTEEKIEKNVASMLELSSRLGIPPFRAGRYLALSHLV